MFKLILHYKYGQAKDLSGNDNHGHLCTPELVEGRNPEVKAFYFNGIDTRIEVLPSATLSNLRGLRATAWLWVEELGQRRNIMEGFLSFAFCIEADRSLRGAIYNGSTWQPIWRSYPNTIPLQEWVYVKYIYDGIDTSVLYVNDKLVASQYGYFGKVQVVQWPFGLNIGAWPDKDRFVFKGKIDEVKLWCYDSNV